MFEATDIREWRGLDVQDNEGSKVGSLEAIYVDTASDDPSFATVQIGLPTRRRLVFVPLAGALVGPSYLRVDFEKRLVKDAPGIPTDGELLAENEEAVFSHYGMDYATGPGGARKLARR